MTKRYPNAPTAAQFRAMMATAAGIGHRITHTLVSANQVVMACQCGAYTEALAIDDVQRASFGHAHEVAVEAGVATGHWVDAEERAEVTEEVARAERLARRAAGRRSRAKA